MGEERTTGEDASTEVWQAASAARSAAIDVVEQGVIILDSQDRVIDMNVAACELLGQSAADGIGRPLSELLSRAERWSGLVELMDGESETRGEIRVDGDAGPRVFAVRFAPIQDRCGVAAGRTILLRDVTEMRRLQRALGEAREAAGASDQAMSEFMSVACHEMRTPITSIKGYTDLLARGTVGSVNEAQVDFLDTVRANADRVALLVSDLSDVARIQSGRLSVDLARVDVRDVVRDAVESMQTQIDGKDQSLTVEIAEDLPEVWADHERSVQVLSNLVSNAHKFTPAGGRIVVRAQPWGGDGEERGVLVEVEDNGIGIQAEEQEKVFEMFYRSEDREASDMPGSGLGLSIASNLVEMQGGRIWLESTFREGTTVSFVLPTELDGA